MNIEFKCPQCGKPVAADESLRGKVVECPHCERGIVVPRGNTPIEKRRNVSLSPRYQRTNIDIHPPQISIPPQTQNTTNDKMVPLFAGRKNKIAYGVLCGINAVTLVLVSVLLFRSSPLFQTGPTHNTYKEDEFTRKDEITPPVPSHAVTEAAEEEAEPEAEEEKTEEE